jgi:hypothetical protein
MFDWTVFWGGVQGVALCATACVAWYQLGALRSDQKGWETLRACEKYETDPVLDRALCSIRDARIIGDLIANPKAHSLEVATVLNYFESLATGVGQGFYVESIIRDHLESVIRDHVAEFLSPPMIAAMNFQGLYDKLLELLKSWTSGETYYRARRFL